MILVVLNKQVLMKPQTLVNSTSARQLGIPGMHQHYLATLVHLQLATIRREADCRLPPTTVLRMTMARISDEIVLAHHHTHTAADMMIRLQTDIAGVVDLLIIATGAAGTLAMSGPDNQIYFVLLEGG